MSAHLKAFFGVAVVIALIAVGFSLFYRPPVENQGTTIDRVENMKVSGVPDFSGPDLFSRPFSLKAHQGKVLIVNFWASWCEPCIEEVPSLLRLVKKLNGQVELIAVSGDTEEKEILSFLKSFPGLKDSNITLFWDKDKKIVQSYGVERLPETFIVGPDLKLIKKVVGSVRWDHEESFKYFEDLVGMTAKAKSQ